MVERCWGNMFSHLSSWSLCAFSSGFEALEQRPNLWTTSTSNSLLNRWQLFVRQGRLWHRSGRVLSRLAGPRVGLSRKCSARSAPTSRGWLRHWAKRKHLSQRRRWQRTSWRMRRKPKSRSRRNSKQQELWKRSRRLVRMSTSLRTTRAVKRATCWSENICSTCWMLTRAPFQTSLCSTMWPTFAVSSFLAGSGCFFCFHFLLFFSSLKIRSYKFHQISSVFWVLVFSCPYVFFSAATHAARHPDAAQKTMKDVFNMAPVFFNAEFQERGHLWGKKVFDFLNLAEDQLTRSPPVRSHFSKFILACCQLKKAK